MGYEINQVPFSTCKGTSNIRIQVSKCKFILKYSMWRWNFREFIKIFHKRLNPFKIQLRFKFKFCVILKLVQRVKFLPMFQTIDLQNLENCGHWEGHQFEFQSLGDWEALKIRNRAGPTCQPQRPLNPPHRSLMRLRMTPCALTRWWPYATGGHRLRFPMSYPRLHYVEEQELLSSSFHSLSLPRHRAPLCSATHSLIPSALSFTKGSRCFPLGFVARASPFRPLHRIPSPTSTGRRWAPSSVLLVIGQVVPNVLCLLA
jgi:hypothetical protein